MGKKIVSDWFVDLEAMTCRHRQSRILVQFSFVDDVFIKGEIVKMPGDLALLWLKYREFCKLSKENVAEARDVFVEEFCKKKTVKNTNEKHWGFMFPVKKKSEKGIRKNVL